MKSVAIFGGSFNPPTKGHQAIASACLENSEFDEVWLMPSGDRLDKAYTIDDAHRLAMLGLLQSRINNPRLVISRLELELERPSQTIKTLGALATKYPGVVPTFVLGADSYWSMPTQAWIRGDYLQQNLQMLIVPRSGFPNPTANNTEILRVPEEFQTVSSSEVRANLATGNDVSHLVDHAIEAYIAEHELYGYNIVHGTHRHTLPHP